MTEIKPDEASWTATPAAARARLAAVDPAAYAASRNHLAGAVTGLGPWITHGVLGLAEVLHTLRRQHALPPRHKLVAELGWRAFFRHVWTHEPEALARSRHPGPRPDDAYALALPEDLLQARTGLAVIDRAVEQLYRHGTLHNHARLWLASYTVHLRGVHWRVGAEWMVAHLLDGDLASNHLSWQWVAGTGSHQPYLFNAENVRRHAPPDWWVDGSALDAPYEALAEVAHGRAPWTAPVPAGLPGTPEPARHAAPPDGGFGPAEPGALAGQDVWLVHPWSLADPPPGRLTVAVLDAAFHRQRPWSAGRWAFVAPRLRALGAHRWLDEPAALRTALSAARSVAGVHDPHLGDWADGLGLAAPEPAFSEPGRACRSFSAWWSRVAPLD